MSRYVLGIDQSTQGTKGLLFDENGALICRSDLPHRQYIDQRGWVEHDPEEIYANTVQVVKKLVEKSGIDKNDIKVLGISNQRETALVWDRNTGKPVYNAVVWQCARGAKICERIAEQGHGEMIRSHTGLQLSPYFSAAKIAWVLENVEGAAEKAEKGELCCGTIDSWLVYKLTGGKEFRTDYSNASRTLLYNINTLEWDEDILKELDIPRCMLPDVKPSSCIYGVTDSSFFGGEIPIGGAAGDQQSALFGQACFSRGDAKNTYGTGCFLLMNTGEQPVFSENGLVTTIAWGLDGKVNYALEGSVFVAGAVIQWLRDELRLIDSAEDSEYMAQKVKDTNGCYVVPAFTGLGAPYWDQYARGTIVGLTRGVNKCHIIRASLESLAYQVHDVIEAMKADSGMEINSLRVDGGASANNFLMQAQADMIQVPVKRPVCVETTAMGAAYMAGLAVGYWNSKEEIMENWSVDRTFTPAITEEERDKKSKGWKKAVKCAYGWAREE